MFKKIFKNADILGSDIFQEELTEKIILICLDVLDKEQYKALLKTAEKLEEAKYLVNTTDGKNEEELEFKNYEDYRREYLKTIMPESCIYSAKGQWGILFCDENFAIMGATEEFMEEFKKNYPS